MSSSTGLEPKRFIVVLTIDKRDAPPPAAPRNLLRKVLRDVSVLCFEDLLNILGMHLHTSLQAQGLSAELGPQKPSVQYFDERIKAFSDLNAKQWPYLATVSKLEVKITVGGTLAEPRPASSSGSVPAAAAAASKQGSLERPAIPAALLPVHHRPAPSSSSATSSRASSVSSLALLATHRSKAVEYLRELLLPQYRNGKLTKPELVVLCSSVCSDYVEAAQITEREFDTQLSRDLTESEKLLLQRLLMGYEPRLRRWDREAQEANSPHAASSSPRARANSSTGNSHAAASAAAAAKTAHASRNQQVPSPSQNANVHKASSILEPLSGAAAALDLPSFQKPTSQLLLNVTPSAQQSLTAMPAAAALMGGSHRSQSSLGLQGGDPATASLGRKRAGTGVGGGGSTPALSDRSVSSHVSSGGPMQYPSLVRGVAVPPLEHDAPNDAVSLLMSPVQQDDAYYDDELVVGGRSGHSRTKPAPVSSSQLGDDTLMAGNVLQHSGGGSRILSVQYSISGRFPATPSVNLSVSQKGQAVALVSPDVRSSDHDVLVAGHIVSRNPVSLTWWLAYGPNRQVLNLDKLYNRRCVTTFQVSETGVLLTIRAGTLSAGWQYFVHLTVTSQTGTVASAETTFTIPLTSAGEGRHLDAADPSAIYKRKLLHPQQNVAAYSVAARDYLGDDEPSYGSRKRPYGPGEAAPALLEGAGDSSSMGTSYTAGPDSPASGFNASHSHSVSTPRTTNNNNGASTFSQPRTAMTFQEQLRKFFLQNIEPLYTLSLQPSVSHAEFQLIIKTVARDVWFTQPASSNVSDQLKRSIVERIKSELLKRRVHNEQVEDRSTEIPSAVESRSQYLSATRK